MGVMEAPDASCDTERVCRTISYAHTYVACEEDAAIASGLTGSFFGGETARVLRMIFVLPEKREGRSGRQGTLPDGKALEKGICAERRFKRQDNKTYKRPCRNRQGLLYLKHIWRNRG